MSILNFSRGITSYINKHIDMKDGVDMKKEVLFSNGAPAAVVLCITPK